MRRRHDRQEPKNCGGIDNHRPRTEQAGLGCWKGRFANLLSGFSICFLLQVSSASALREEQEMATAQIPQRDIMLVLPIDIYYLPKSADANL